MLLEHAFGGLGSVLLVVAYWLGTTGRLPVKGIYYQTLNLAGAIILLIYSAIFGAWMNVVLEVIWGGIAIAALYNVSRSANLDKR